MLLGVMAVGAMPAHAASTYLPPALYAGGDLTLSNTAKITSTVVGGQPTAAVYVKNKLTNTGSGSLSTVPRSWGRRAPACPRLSVFLPQSRIDQLVAASQAAKLTTDPATIYKGLSFSDSKDYLFTAPITVNGNLSITGSGKCTFDTVYVTGNVVIKNTLAKVSFAALRVNGSLTVSSGTLSATNTFVVGNTSLAGSGTWNMGLLVTRGASR